ncbi:MAG TPA: DUF3619 family protein [Burkholderiaceae bacterium]|nr:DUF3619 family protein [Burkholderiaceae bacterium]HRP28485.1 DUF3619 family protein [Burkholderiaceae bacterium]
MPARAPETEALQSRYAMRIAARLSDQSDRLAPDIGERLRFARQRAIDHARAMRTMRAPAQPGAGVVPAGAATLAFGGEPRESSPWRIGLLSLLPLLALVAGLMLIHSESTRRQVTAAFEVDTALLLDTLPPSAYGDAGFIEFLEHHGD